MHQLLLGYTLVFIGLVFMLLITVRNRYIPLIGCALALFGVEGFLLTITMKDYPLPSLLMYIFGLLFLDALILLILWWFFSLIHNPERDDIQGLAENKNGPAGWLIYAWSVIDTKITPKWFQLFLCLLFIFWCITSCVRSCRTFPDG